jgi:hypothetical protein
MNAPAPPPPSVITYRTQDGLADYQFSILAPTAGTDVWRITLRHAPALDAAIERLIKDQLARLILADGQPTIQATQPLTSELTAKLYAAQWADQRQSLATAAILQTLKSTPA